MTILAFEPFSGAAGDMLTACLVDLGSDAAAVRENMEAAAAVSVEICKVKKSGIRATRVNVRAHETSRSYSELIDDIQSCGISSEMLADAKAIFEMLAEAEAAVHGVHRDELVFHQVGAQDAIADVIGACTAISQLKADSVITTPICVGGGVVETAHGQLPVPAPATAAILAKYHLITRGGPIEDELLTPTGAAILAHFTSISDVFLPQMTVERVGYGAGSRNYAHPNVLRALLGQPSEDLLVDDVQVLETNVDDVTGEVLGSLTEGLLEIGALDVAIMPTTGKKSRTGHLIQVIAQPADAHRLAKKIIQETGSLGVRFTPTHHRVKTLRRFETVTVPIGNEFHSIRVKVAADQHGTVFNVAAEFDEAAAVAKKLNIPVKRIMRIAEESAWKRFGG
ncbi:MAG TPA: nickel pincer cofactor biosynthesis protein LarC [Candidatus Bathyarchaeia archaeon]|nr:nickel pincer cofactor biosynthesis protein LarC [Candidatus Bathyarchaeia archaeon]